MRPVRSFALVMYCFAFTFGTFCTVGSLCAATPSEEMIRLGVPGTGVGSIPCGGDQDPYFFADFDFAGFTDVIYYTRSPSHQYNCHEILSGEWAAAIYYEDVNTVPVDPENPAAGNKSMWLTDKFLYPDWSTNSDFKASVGHTFYSWDDPINPTSEYDTGRTAITNDDLEIIIDYEVVDLGYGDPATNTLRSPMAFRLPGISRAFFCESQQYIILQTYTIRNLKPVPLKGLEFYQLLHSHPGGEEFAALSSVYEDQLPEIEDPLNSYVPFNSVHCAPDSNTVGNFRYDITQWNDLGSSNSSVGHSDWVGFSTNVKPDVIDHDYFIGHGEDPDPFINKPSEGSHINIENRTLNGLDELHGAETAGAMGWFLGNLAPNESTSMTFAFMFGQRETSGGNLTFDSLAEVNFGNPCGVTKVDPTNPDYDQIIYAIEFTHPPNDSYDSNEIKQVEGAYVVDKLPPEVDFISASPGNYIYNAQEHTCTWALPPIKEGDFEMLTIVVRVTERAAPASEIVNETFLIADRILMSDIETVDVCCWQSPANQSGVIYVDASAVGKNNGLGWQDAYVDLQRALTQVSNGCGSEIWVAAGYYGPTDDPSQLGSSFQLSNGVTVYGGFPTGGGTWQQRDYTKNLTWLTGDLAGGVNSQNIIQAEDVSSTAVLDGFVIVNGSGHGVVSLNSAITIKNCLISGNGTGGVLSKTSDLQITGSIISGNTGNGVSFADDVSSTKQTSPRITNNMISSNSEYGLSIDSRRASIFVANNFINSNGTNSSGGGVSVSNYDTDVLLQNNTIIYNNNVGVVATNTADPNVVNCIVWGHTNDIIDCSKVSYSCFAQATAANGNINKNPGFAYADPSDFHLDSNSPCIDSGDPSRNYIAQSDLDSDNRVIDVAYEGTGVNDIDIGADEYACDDLQNPLDFNKNHIVGMDDFIQLSQRWLLDITVSDPNHACYDVAPEEGDNIIDILDFIRLMEEWMWEPCWQDNSSELWIHHKRLYRSILQGL